MQSHSRSVNALTSRKTATLGRSESDSIVDVGVKMIPQSEKGERKASKDQGIQVDEGEASWGKRVGSKEATHQRQVDDDWGRNEEEERQPEIFVVCRVARARPDDPYDEVVASTKPRASQSR